MCTGGEHPVCFLAICISLEKCLFNFFTIFQWVVDVLLSHKSSLHMMDLWIWICYQIQHLQTFSPIQRIVFSLCWWLNCNEAQLVFLRNHPIQPHKLPPMFVYFFSSLMIHLALVLIHKERQNSKGLRYKLNTCLLYQVPVLMPSHTTWDVVISYN